MDCGDHDNDILSAPLVIEYPFKRSVGPVLGAFFTGLRAGIIIGIRRRDGSVMVPPAEYDPADGAALDDLVEVGDCGEVTSWAWIARPRPNQPLQQPFAWALIKLDGADTALLHAVDAGEEARMSTHMRVRARWADQRQGCIGDILCFEPEES